MLSARGLHLGLLMIALLAQQIPATLTAHAQAVPSWPTNGVSVVDPHRKGYAFGVMGLADGGGTFLWVPKSYTDFSRIARLTSAGTIPTNWPTGGIRLPGPGRIGGRMVPDAVGGMFFVYQMVQYGDYFAFRFDRNGVPVPGWGDSSGKVPVALSGDALIFGSTTMEDGSGGFYFAWDTGLPDQSAIRLRRISSLGSSSPGWPDTGIVVYTAPEGRGGPSIIPDGADGVLLTWVDHRSGEADVYAQRVSGDGRLLWTDFPSGRPVDTRPLLQYASPVADGNGGMFVFIHQTEAPVGRQVDFFVQHLLADGSFAPGFSATPKPVAVAPGYAQNLMAIPDGTGGAFISFEDYRSGGPDFYLHHLSATGDPMPGWPVNGLAVGADRGRGEFYGRIASDMQGGVWCAYESEGADGRRIFTQHVRGDGTLALGWPAGGVPVSPGLPDAWDEGCFVESDGRGGAIIYWSRQGPTFETWGAFAQRFGPAAVVATTLSLASSTAEPGRVSLDWLASGDALTSATLERRSAASDVWSALASLTPDGSGHLRHDDTTVEPGMRYAYRLRYSASASERLTAEAWIDVPAAHRFALEGAQPNPALGRDLRVAFSLRTGAPASLELYDVHGRRVTRLDVGGKGPGRQAIALGRGQRIDAGIYWLRLSQGTDVATARAVVME